MFLSKSDYTPAYAEQYMKIQAGKTEPEILIHKACKDCPYYHYCGKDVPEYSVFDLLPQKDADVFYAETGKMEIKDVPASTCTTPKQLIDREAFLTNEVHVEPEEIKACLVGSVGISTVLFGLRNIPNGHSYV